MTNILGDDYCLCDDYCKLWYTYMVYRIPTTGGKNPSVTITPV